MSAPLAGLRVVELARILAGPWIGQTLADLGAEVVKLESPAGDDTRRWGPPFQGADAAYFHACNRGKRSVTADLTTEAGRARAASLIAGADIVVENFRRGGLVKHGLDPEALRARHPRLIVASITGFGQDGPYADRPGYDYLIQAMGGIMSLTGPADGEPHRMGVAFADIMTGLYGVIGILAAVRRRDETGLGEWLDLSLLDTMVATLANQAQNFLATGTPPARTGNSHPNIVPYQTVPCADGRIVVTVGNDAQFAAFARVLGADWPADPRFATNPARVAHRAALTAEIEARSSARPQAELAAALQAAGVPAGPINDLAQVFADPQVIARALQIAPGGVPGIRTPLRFADATLRLDRPAPALGQDDGWPGWVTEPSPD